MNAIDTNIFVYSIDFADPVKQATAERLLDDLAQRPGETLLLWQVAVELLAYWRKIEALGHATSEQAKAYFDNLLAAFPLRTPALATLEHSFTLRTRHSLSHWDSLLIAACLDAGVDRHYSEDMTQDADYDGVRTVNPFLNSPHLPQS